MTRGHVDSSPSHAATSANCDGTVDFDLLDYPVTVCNGFSFHAAIFCRADRAVETFREFVQTRFAQTFCFQGYLSGIAAFALFVIAAL